MTSEDDPLATEGTPPVRREEEVATRMRHPFLRRLMWNPLLVAIPLAYSVTATYLNGFPVWRIAVVGSVALWFGLSAYDWITGHRWLDWVYSEDGVPNHSAKGARKRVRIVAVPPGEAPSEVRQAWVGLSLPLTDQCPGPVAVPRYGLQTGPQTWLGHIWRVLTGQAPARHACYLVPVIDALTELAAADPAAADWWRENAPHLIASGQMFCFPVEVCRLDPESETPPDSAA